MSEANLSRMLLAVYYACYAGEPSSLSGDLLAETCNSGADAAVGFRKYVRGGVVATDWADMFWWLLSVAMPLGLATDQATEYVVDKYKGWIPEIEQMRQWRIHGNVALEILPARYGM